MLQSLKKKPSDVRFRKMRLDNIVVKKYITSIEGAQGFLEAVGFRQVESNDKGKKLLYLSIEEVDVKPELLEKAIEFLEANPQETPAAAAGATATTAAPATATPTAPKAKKDCAGGCGFFGDEKTEDMCSLCYRKKYFGGKEKDEQKKNTTPAKPAGGKCIKGCGNFGSESRKWMCSKCFEKYGAQRKAWRKRWTIVMLKLKALRRFQLGKKPEQKNKNRCWHCNKRIGISGIECRCGFIFCGKHRYPDEHTCQFDHKQLHKQKLAKENQEVKGQKFEKIKEDK
jgi:hypothetical protein